MKEGEGNGVELMGGVEEGRVSGYEGKAGKVGGNEVKEGKEGKVPAVVQ